MRATLVSFLEQSPFATSDIIGHMTVSFVIHAVLRYDHSKFSKMAASRHLGFGATGSRSIRSAVPENPTYNQTGSRSDDPFQRYGHLKR